MTVTRQQVFPRRIQEEQQAIQDMVKIIDAELQKTTSQPNEPKYVQVEFDRFTSSGTDLFTSYVLDPVLERYQARLAGWKFEHPAIVTTRLGSNNSKIVFVFT